MPRNRGTGSTLSIAVRCPISRISTSSSMARHIHSRAVTTSLRSRAPVSRPSLAWTSTFRVARSGSSVSGAAFAHKDHIFSLLHQAMSSFASTTPCTTWAEMLSVSHPLPKCDDENSFTIHAARVRHANRFYHTIPSDLNYSLHDCN